MDLELIVESIMGLVIVLGLLIFLLFFMFPEEDNKKKKVAVSKDNKSNELDTSLPALKKIVKNRISSTDKLSQALDLIIKHHGSISKKTAGRSHADFDIYMDILFTICRHPNTNKTIIIKFDKELTDRNPEYKSDINDAVTKGLNSRRVN